MKIKLSALLIAVVQVLLLVSCGSNPASGTASGIKVKTASGIMEIVSVKAEENFKALAVELRCTGEQEDFEKSSQEIIAEIEKDTGKVYVSDETSKIKCSHYATVEGNEGKALILFFNVKQDNIGNSYKLNILENAAVELPVLKDLYNTDQGLFAIKSTGNSDDLPGPLKEYCDKNTAEGKKYVYVDMGFVTAYQLYISGGKSEEEVKNSIPASKIKVNGVKCEKVSSYLSPANTAADFYLIFKIEQSQNNAVLSWPGHENYKFQIP